MTRRLQIIDISEPYIPDSIGACDYSRTGDWNLDQRGFCLFGEYGAGMQVIDISNPAYPTIAGHYNTPNEAQDVCVQDNYAYIADRYSGLQIADISNTGGARFLMPAATTLRELPTESLSRQIHICGGWQLASDFHVSPTGVDDAEELPSGFSLARTTLIPLSLDYDEYQLPRRRR